MKEVRPFQDYFIGICNILNIEYLQGIQFLPLSRWKEKHLTGSVLYFVDGRKNTNSISSVL